MWLAGCNLAGPAAEQDEALASREAAIVNGRADGGHPAVGLLYWNSSPVCTATLVGPRTVLTAAHCVTDDTRAPFRIAPTIVFAPGDGSGRMYLAGRAVVHPAYGRVGTTWRADVAVVQLTKPVSGVAPLPIAARAPLQGERVTLVGYGASADDAPATAGRKRRADNRIGKVSSHLISFFGFAGTLGNICFGDSGGPAIARRGGVEVQVGVHSYGEGACGDAEHDQRVDVYAGWIQQVSGHQVDIATTPPDPPSNGTITYEGELPGAAESELAGGCRLGASDGAAGAPLAPLVVGLLGLALRRRS